MIDFGEQYALMNPEDGPEGFDLPYYILAHEVAHQWWGGVSLRPANVEGAGVLIEGMAVYSGMQVLEKSYVAGHLRHYVSYLHSSYAMPRSLASASLLQADEAFLYYRKGGLAMHALSRYIGKAQVKDPRHVCRISGVYCSGRPRSEQIKRERLRLASTLRTRPANITFALTGLPVKAKPSARPHHLKSGERDLNFQQGSGYDGPYSPFASIMLSSSRRSIISMFGSIPARSGRRGTITFIVCTPERMRCIFR